MLPGGRITRVRFHSTQNPQELELGVIGRDDARISNVLKKTLAQACTESSYNSVLNINVLRDAVRQKPSLIVLMFSNHDRFQFRVSLKSLRRFLLAGNLIVLATVILAFSAWSIVSQVGHAHERQKSGLEPHPWILNDFNPLLAKVLPYLDQVLFVFSNYLMLYYLVFGFIFSMFYGGQTNLLCVVLMTPVTVIMSFALVCSAALVLHFRGVFHENLDRLNSHAHGHLGAELQLALLELHRALDTFGIPFSVLAVLASLVKLIMSVLPWFLYDLPFQRMLDIEDMVVHDIEKRKVNNYPRPAKGQSVRRNINISQDSPHPQRCPYRKMSSAYTVLLQLVQPELRALHRI